MKFRKRKLMAFNNNHNKFNRLQKINQGKIHLEKRKKQKKGNKTIKLQKIF